MRIITLRNLGIAALILLSIFLITSCGSKKTLTTSGKLEKKSSSKIVSDALASELQYKTITTKGSIELNFGGSPKKSTTVFKIIKDSIIQASVRPVFGVEAIRINFTPRNVVIIDRLKKTYISEDIKDSKLMANFDFNYYNLQALFTNQLFIPGKELVSKSDHERYNITATEDVYMLQTKDKGNLLYTFAVDASNRVISTLIYNEKKNVTLQWSYSEFIEDKEAIYPTLMNAKIDIDKKRLDVGISFNKLDINKDFDVDTSIPSKYEKVDISELLAPYIKKKK